MRIRRRDSGSAIILAIVIVIMAAGIGGAFLAESVFRSKTQHKEIEAEETVLMCDAALERARRALYYYRKSSLWTWNEILAYCSTRDKNGIQILQDYKALSLSSLYTSYSQTLGDGNDSVDQTIHVTDGALPGSKTTPAAADRDSSKVFIGWNVPFLKGSVYTMVKDNDDGDGNALVDSDNKVLIVITATLPDGTQRAIEAHIEYKEVKMNVNGIAALVGNDDIEVTGNMKIDGQNWNIDGTAEVGSGNVYGVVGKNGVTPNGNSVSISGNGTSYSNNTVVAGAIKANYSFPTGYPAGPDEAVGLPSGTLKAMAQSSGGYFATAAQWNAFMSANNDKPPGGRVYFLEFDPSASNSSFEIGKYTGNQGPFFNETPSIMVVHTPTMTGTIKNLHGGFKGLLLVDAIDHVNAGTEILGMVQVLSPTAASTTNTLGNGDARLRYSSAALANLPQLSPESANLLSWRKILH
jgi:hypothetical protein